MKPPSPHDDPAWDALFARYRPVQLPDDFPGCVLAAIPVPTRRRPLIATAAAAVFALLALSFTFIAIALFDLPARLFDVLAAAPGAIALAANLAAALEPVRAALAGCAPVMFFAALHALPAAAALALIAVLLLHALRSILHPLKS